MVRLFRWSLFVFICVVLALVVRRQLRSFKLEGNEDGISMNWSSNSSCTVDRLWAEVANASQDIGVRDGTMLTGGPYVFEQVWQTRDDGNGELRRDIGYQVYVFKHLGEPTTVSVFGESHRQRGISMPAVDFDDPYKSHARQFISALLERGKDCGLVGVEAIVYP